MVADILCEFLEVAIHLILYVREVYPSGIFQKRKKYNVPVQVGEGDTPTDPGWFHISLMKHIISSPLGLVARETRRDTDDHQGRAEAYYIFHQNN